MVLEFFRFINCFKFFWLNFLDLKFLRLLFGFDLYVDFDVFSVNDGYYLLFFVLIFCGNLFRLLIDKVLIKLILYVFFIFEYEFDKELDK